MVLVPHPNGPHPSWTLMMDANDRNTNGHADQNMLRAAISNQRA